jgi:hypothetical protein
VLLEQLASRVLGWMNVRLQSKEELPKPPGRFSTVRVCHAHNPVHQKHLDEMSTSLRKPVKNQSVDLKIADDAGNAGILKCLKPLSNNTAWTRQRGSPLPQPVSGPRRGNCASSNLSPIVVAELLLRDTLLYKDMLTSGKGPQIVQHSEISRPTSMKKSRLARLQLSSDRYGLGERAKAS